MVTPVASAQSLDELLQALAGFTSASPGVTRPVYGDAWCDAQRWLAERAGWARVSLHMATPAAAVHTLDELLQALAGFTSASPGVTRPVYGDAWCDAQRWLAERARALGLAATCDGIGNLFFHAPEVKPGDLSRSVLLVGSHLDTVPGGGAYDGAVGVLAALLVAAELRERRALPVVGFASCAGEDSRFGGCGPGARGILGLLRQEDLDGTRDLDGVTWRRALEHARGRGCAAPPAAGERPCPALFHPALMLELHVEQGPVLETEGIELGIVEHVSGCRRMRVRLQGETRYSGTTPMNLRRDALAAAAEMVLAAERAARKAGPPAVATAGFLRAEPGRFSAVPGSCELWLEVRHFERPRLVDLTAAIGQRCREIAQERGLGIEVDETTGHDPVAMSPKLTEAAAKLADRLGLSHGGMVSGAAHDAMEFARHGVPCLLVFVPSRHGASHSPEEFTDPAQLAAGHRYVLEFARWLTDARG